MIALNGILAPLVTPFQDSGELDLEGFGRNIRAHLAAGCIGVVVTGSTGEAAGTGRRRKAASARPPTQR